MDKKELKQEIMSLGLLENLTKAYAEIASRRMKVVRGSVLTNRDFLLALNSIFAEVRGSYTRQVMALAKKKAEKGEGITFLAHNGKTAAVLLSANTGLYGDIVPRTFRLFLEEVRKGDTEAVIVGRLGLSLYLQEEPTRPYTYFDLPDYGVDKAQLATVVAHLAPYEKIRIFYGKFENIVRQEPTLFNISAETPIAQSKAEGGEREIKYLFEPSLEEILVFFESEMFTSLFEQSVRESQLSKFASRMLSMDSAAVNIGKKITAANLRMLQLMHSITNKKQTNTFGAFMIWGKR